MSPICQTFVQNAWKKDLCSNCFKSEQDHGSSRKENFRSGYNSNDVHARRYVGVAGRSGMYSRNYYGAKSWNPLMIDNSNKDSRLLKSPGLIKGMDSIIKQENEKNQSLNEFSAGDQSPKVTTVRSTLNIPKDSWILSQIIGEPKGIKNVERSERNGDSSSDLGSDASHDTSSSGNTSGCSEGDMKVDSDASSIKSEPDSAHEEESLIHGILKTSHSHPSGRGSISFKDDSEVIGYGGDVDYSDDDNFDDDDDDDDDDNSSISSSELSPEERYMKRLTEKNTDFNSENENLMKDPPANVVNDLHRYKFEMDLETESQDNQNSNEKLGNSANKHEVKVKLKRSHPIAGLKPNIKSNSFSSSSSAPLYTASDLTNKESIPMQGIKPKFVSREEEMQENSAFEDIYHSNKVTSIDDLSPKITSIDNISPKITSIDNISPKITSIDNISPKITSIDDIGPKITSIDDISQKITSIDDIGPKITSIDDIGPKITSIDDIGPKITSVDSISHKNTLSPRIISVDNISSKIMSVDNISSKISSVNNVYPKITSVDNIFSKIAINRITSKSAIDRIASKTSSVDDITPKVTSLTNGLPKRGSCDNILTQTSFKERSPPKSSSVDNLLHHITSADDIASENARCNIISNAGNRENNKDNFVKEIMSDECPEIIYVDDISTYECKLADQEESEAMVTKTISPLFKGAEKNENSISSTKDISSESNSKEAFKGTEEIDYSVRSAQSILRIAAAQEELLSKSDRSSKILENVSSAVIPMNMITIQRRSSFMESQLGGTEFSFEAPLKKSPSSATPGSYSPNKNINKEKDLSLFKENIWFQNKALSQGNGPERLSSSLLKSIKTSSQKSNTKIARPSTEHEIKQDKADTQKENTPLTTPKQLDEGSGENTVIKDESEIHSSSSLKPSEEKSDTINKYVNISNNINKYENVSNSINKYENVNTRKSSPLSVTNSTSDSINNNNNNNNNNLNNNNNITKESFQLIPKLIRLNSNNSDTGSASEKLSTFGTPVTPTKAPNSSFLHSGAVRPLTEASEINSVIYSTPEFLKDIKSKASQPPVTASIQKASLHASSSSSSSGIKGIPLGKPATTPKPIYLRDKPKVPVKPFISSNVYNREHPLLKTSSSDILPNEPIQDDLFKNNKSVSSSQIETKTHVIDEINKINNCNWSHGVSERACEVTNVNGKEIVYDLPVTVSPSNTTTTFSSPSPSSSSSGYSTTSNMSHNGDVNLNNYSENLKSEQIVVHADVTPEKNDSYYRAKFEATKEILSESLSFEVKPLTNDCNDCEASPNSDPVSEENHETKKSHEEIVPLEPTPQNENEQVETLSTSTLQSQHESHDYVNISPAYETHDVDSYSSFTDDFDDDEEEESNGNTNANQYVPPEENSSPLRRTERSSSATPLFRNSVGPVNYCTTNAAAVTSSEKFNGGDKHPAVRSRSVPRSGAIDSSVFHTPRTDSTFAKFPFVKSGFFRPSSPPSMKRKSSSERGRDRTKKSHSGFSLKKLLRFGSGEKMFRSKDESKEQEKNFQRETRKMKLQIIHPLDYNTTGVEVISRPEKRSPTYDFTGINDPLIQEALRQHALEQNKKTTGEAVEKPSSPSEASLPQPSKERNSFSKSTSGSERKVAKKNSFLRKKRKSERSDVEKNEVYTATSSYVRPSENSTDNNARDSRSSVSSNTDTHSGTHVTGNLGFNSEGRPKPPPPPRKTSLDSNSDLLKASATFHSNFSIGASSNGFKADYDTSSISSTCSSTRPSRPPPPRRAPSSGASRHKDSLYANLGNARASFTPRKPGRTASVRDEEREKRKAPKPPPPPSQQHLISSTHVAGNPSDLARQGKGPAPPTPVCSRPTHNYEYISSSPEKLSERQDQSDLEPSDPLTTLTLNKERELEPPEGYVLPAYIQYSTYFKDEREKQEIVRSSSSLNQEKTTRQRGRRGSIVTNLSLEDQYGAVVHANLEALSNLLDQMYSHNAYEGYERIVEQISNCSMIALSNGDPISCGFRLFYSASAVDCSVTVMVTPETKVDVDPLLMPKPLVILKDDIPSSFLLKGRSADHSFTSGTLWILPQMTLCSLEEFSHYSQALLKDRACDWERRICLFLLQVVSALKQLQAKGIEEVCLDTILVITDIYDDDNPRVLMASSEANNGNASSNPASSCVSLCHCAAAATQLLLGNNQPLETAMEGPVLCPPSSPNPHAFLALITTLREERSSSLTKAKCILEAMVFGPEDMKVNCSQSGELAIQKWLDLERANVLHSLVREQANGSFNKNCILTKFQLLFLVRTNAKALKDAMRSLEAPDVTNF